MLNYTLLVWVFNDRPRSFFLLHWSTPPPSEPQEQAEHEAKPKSGESIHFRKECVAVIFGQFMITRTAGPGLPWNVLLPSRVTVWCGVISECKLYEDPNLQRKKPAIWIPKVSMYSVLNLVG